MSDKEFNFIKLKDGNYVGIEPVYFESSESSNRPILNVINSDINLVLYPKEKDEVEFNFKIATNSNIYKSNKVPYFLIIKKSNNKNTYLVELYLENYPIEDEDLDDFFNKNLLDKALTIEIEPKSEMIILIKSMVISMVILFLIYYLFFYEKYLKLTTNTKREVFSID